MHTGKNENYAQTTLLHAIMPQFWRWHQHIGVSWREEIDDGDLLALCRHAGYNTRGKTPVGALLMPIGPKRLEPAIVHRLSKKYVKDENTSSVNLAILLSGLLQLRSAIPNLVRIVDDGCEDDTTVLQVGKALTMLEYDAHSLTAFLERSVDRFPENGRLTGLLVRQLALTGSRAHAETAFSLIQSIESEDQKSRVLPYLASIHKQGVDTSGILEFVLKDAKPHFAWEIAQWAHAVATPHVLEPLLDLHNANSFAVLCLALGDPSVRHVLRPLLIDREKRWIQNENIDCRYKIALIALLGALGRDVSMYIDSGDEWELWGPWGVALGLALRDGNGEFSELAAETDNPDIEKIDQFTQLMLGETSDAFLEREALDGYFLDVCDGLRVIIRSIMAAHHRSSALGALGALRAEHVLATERNHERLLQISEHAEPVVMQILSSDMRHGGSWRRIFTTDNDVVPLEVFNLGALVAGRDSPRVRFLLGEVFLKDTVFPRAEDTMLLAELVSGAGPSDSYAAKKRLHTEDFRINTLDRIAFDTVYPYLFSSDHFRSDTEYPEAIVRGAFPVIVSDSQIAMQVLRLCSLPHELNDRLLNAVSGREGESLATDLANVISDRVARRACAKDIDLAVGPSIELVLAQFRAVQRGEHDILFSREVVTWLLLADEMQLPDVDIKKIDRVALAEQALRIFDAPEASGILRRTLKSSRFSNDIANLIRLLQDYPSQDFIPLVESYLDSEFSEVSTAARSTLSALIREQKGGSHEHEDY